MNKWFQPIEPETSVHLCPGSPMHSRNSFQLGLWLADLMIHHFWNELYFWGCRAWIRRQCPGERSLNGKMVISQPADILILRFISCILWLASPISMARAIIHSHSGPPKNEISKYSFLNTVGAMYFNKNQAIIQPFLQPCLEPMKEKE